MYNVVAYAEANNKLTEFSVYYRRARKVQALPRYNFFSFLHHPGVSTVEDKEA